jgi:hypothetical protein
MPFLRPVNIPAPLIGQSVFAVGLGLYMALFRKPAFVRNGYTLVVPANASPRTADTISFLGIVLTGLQVCYLVTSYMPIEENQFIAASVPVRLGLAALMGTICIVHRKTMSRSGFMELAALAALDGAMAIWLGFYIGRWDGMVKNAERWL